MRIVMFGGSGYIAVKTLEFLVEEHEVTIADLHLPTKTTPGFTFAQCDITDIEAVKKIVDSAEVIYNFAACSSLEGCNADPCRAIDINLRGHVNILQSCIDQDVKKYIYASSVYAISKYGGIYGITKRASEELVLHYHNEHRLPFVGLRYGTIYGPEKAQGNSLYQLIRQAMIERCIVYNGSGRELREFIHIDDAARLTATMIDDKYSNEFYTLTGPHPYTLSDIIELVREILDRDIEINYRNAPAKYHYTRTPANLLNIVSKKIVSDHYVDIHQGLLDVVNTIHGELHATD
ncbi:MAG: NAD(P)-dependent oxidoreductase [Desulfobacterales bacterium]|nr:NAD(P)-dependent oxidoreductase [Desulfobacterales bacterium]